MRGALQRLEPEGTGPALDRMRGPEDGVEPLHVRVVHVQLQKMGFHLRQELVRLFEKRVVEFGDIHVHSRTG